MDNPVDNPLDLGLVNYTKHPTNNDYVVYRFADEHRAKSFEEEVITQGIGFEKDTEERKSTTFFLYAIHKNDFKKTSKINLLVEAKHKKPLIPSAIFRYTLMIISFGALTLAIVGFCKNQNNTSSVNDSDSAINTTSQVE